MVADTNKTSLGLEYFCNQGDAFWSKSDSELIDLAKKELDKNRTGPGDRRLRCVRLSRAEVLSCLRLRVVWRTASRNYIKRHAEPAVRWTAGMHRYNNQDHFDAGSDVCRPKR